MFRAFKKWLIAHASQREAPLPRWLRLWVQRDDELTRFASASRQLDALLRRDAADWIARQSSDGRTAPDRRRPARPVTQAAGWSRRRLAWSLAAGGVAACVLVVVVSWNALNDAASPIEAAGKQMANARSMRAIGPHEREQLMAAWRAGQASIYGWKSEVAEFSGRISSMQWSPAASLLTPAEVAGSAAARVLASVDSAAEAQQRELADGMKSAYLFFAHRLPASVAQLVGLQGG